MYAIMIATSTKPAEVVKYESALPPDIGVIDTQNEEVLLQLRTQISYLCQGSAVFVSAAEDPLAAVLACTIAFSTAEEFAVRGVDTEDVLLFVHTDNPRLRYGVNETLYRTLSRVLETQPLLSDVLAPPDERHLDLEVLWNELDGTDGAVQEADSLLERLAKYLEPTRRMTIEGTMPILPLLCTVLILRGSVESLTYRDALGRELVLFS